MDKEAIFPPSGIYHSQQHYQSNLLWFKMITLTIRTDMKAEYSGFMKEPRLVRRAFICVFVSFSHSEEKENMNGYMETSVINFYMELLTERGKLENYPSVYAFSTFFYPRLLSGGHAALKRWTRKVDIFSHDLIIVPVHLGVHWCLATIDFRNKAVKYYDSMGSPNNKCLQSLMKYLQDESLDKKKTAFDTSGWQTENVQKIPQQMNGSDCGMFACTFAEYICRDVDITFTQQEMPYFRRKMVYEIYTCKLLM
ncbi:hypothetical protein Cfor_07923 [Coptotermes formosanus]|uniref:Ubiquitin-like protease family profile domain-containing protein n=1 Tax=Coptotermes formosanus TaxID=36987 RepID=A0A6L2PXZ0_COPFO|nr:hypothetical protein Cfor_07923 [Coptotermes formosanus]